VIIDNFHAPGFDFLSNFYPCIMWMPHADGKQRYYRTLEHAYQAAKFNRDSVRDRIRRCKSAAGAKGMARYLINTARDPSYVGREVWAATKNATMLTLLRTKFSAINPELVQALKETGTATLIEGNTWGDRYWGCVEENGNWVGHNWLGKLLMQVRAEVVNNEASR
jgi:ribA/ribD-fused uncharacterized protein